MRAFRRKAWAVQRVIFLFSLRNQTCAAARHLCAAPQPTLTICCLPSSRASRMMRRLLFSIAAAAASTITPEQASKLRSLGYRASEIAAIRPSVASVVARRGLPRPKAGMPPSWVVDDAELAQAVRTRPRPLAGVAGFLNKLVFSLTMLARDLAEVTRRAAIPVGVVLVASQADRIRSTIAAKPPSGEGYFLFDGPTDPAMRGGAKVQISPASAPSTKR